VFQKYPPKRLGDICQLIIKENDDDDDVLKYFHFG